MYYLDSRDICHFAEECKELQCIHRDSIIGRVLGWCATMSAGWIRVVFDSIEPYAFSIRLLR